MRETRPSGSEGGGTQPNESSLPLFTERTLAFQSLLFLRHPDIQSDVWAIPPPREYDTPGIRFDQLDEPLITGGRLDAGWHRLARFGAL